MVSLSFRTPMLHLGVPPAPPFWLPSDPSRSFFFRNRLFKPPSLAITTAQACLQSLKMKDHRVETRNRGGLQIGEDSKAEPDDE